MDWLERILLWRFLWRDYDTRGRCERFNFLLALRFHFDSGTNAIKGARVPFWARQVFFQMRIFSSGRTDFGRALLGYFLHARTARSECESFVLPFAFAFSFRFATICKLLQNALLRQSEKVMCKNDGPLPMCKNDVQKRWSAAPK